MGDRLGQPVGTFDEDSACRGLLPLPLAPTARWSTKTSARSSTRCPHHDLLVGGFPCQDYSVAKTLNQARGLEGKKGVLWWSIYGSSSSGARGTCSSRTSTDC